ncbi:MAG: alpha/beta hydrolase [Pseudomonadota bacterium]
MRMLWGGLLIIGVGVVAALFALWLFQRNLIYYPDPTRVSPSSIGLKGVKEVVLKRPQGIDVVAWRAVAREGQPTLLYFHGNASNLAARAERIYLFQQAGWGLLMMSYRGYSGSTGAPTEKDNIGDALAAYESLTASGVKPADIILYGESLGSGVAVQVAASRPVGGIILDAPYTSLADAGARIYPYLPVKLALTEHYDSLSVIDKVGAPLLIVHGTEDDIIPFDLGQKLYEAAKEPKTFVGLKGAGHSDHYGFGSFDRMREWMGEIRR